MVHVAFPFPPQWPYYNAGVGFDISVAMVSCSDHGSGTPIQSSDHINVEYKIFDLSRSP